MKKLSNVITIFSTLGLIILTGGGQLHQAQAEPESVLPASLDNFYPPKAQAPVYLIAMHKMAAPLSGIMIDLMEKDVPNAMSNLDKFKMEYTEIAKMIPEWAQYFPAGDLAQLEAAIKSGEQSKVMDAMQTIGKNCASCHHKAMPLAHFKYHWGDFSSISAADPVTNSDMPFSAFMHMVETSMTGVAQSVEQGQIENARTYAQGLDLRLTALRETCSACHQTERHYYVDKSVSDMVGNLKAKLNEQNISPPEIMEIIGAIGQESCQKCHLVHIPAAYARANLSAH